MKVLVIGDVHGRWRAMNELIKMMMPDMVLQCGDFGYFPRYVFNGRSPHDPNNHVDKRTPIHWCDGNHEDHEVLTMLRGNIGGKRGAFEIATNVYWQDRGSTLTLPDGRVVLFMGGADSIDKQVRKQGHDWFPGELINWGDMLALPDCHVDIVVSHTCPNRFELPLGFSDKEADPSRQFLDEVLARYSPSQWFFGHWHEYMRGQTGNCMWEGLDMLTAMFKPGCFTWIYGDE